MMSRGFDTTSDCTDYGQAILDAGYSFVGRYYDSLTESTKTKLSRAEALHLSNMGIYLVAVFENASDNYGYFSYHQGYQDGTAAYRYAVDVIQQPYNTPIYFAVDYDATAFQIRSQIASYFAGVMAAFVHQAVSPEPNGTSGTFHIGVYGSGLTCSILDGLNAVSYKWLAQSTGWAGYGLTTCNLRQFATRSWNGMAIDPLVSNGDGGGFQVK